MRSTEKSWTLYVLRLESEKWYVGITSKTPEERFEGHLRGRQAYWTQKYRAIAISDQKSLGDLSYQDALDYENKVTLAYMKKYGINNVRGGNYTDVSKYKTIFGYLFDEVAWGAIMVMGFLLLLNLYTLILLIRKG